MASARRVVASDTSAFLFVRRRDSRAALLAPEADADVAVAAVAELATGVMLSNPASACSCAKVSSASVTGCAMVVLMLMIQYVMFEGMCVSCVVCCAWEGVFGVSG